MADPELFVDIHEPAALTVDVLEPIEEDFDSPSIKNFVTEDAEEAEILNTDN